MSETLTKAKLIDHIQSAHTNLQAAIVGLTEEQTTRPGVIGDWSIKDLIAHLTYWERRAAFLLKSAISGYQKNNNTWETDSVDNQNAQNFHSNEARPLADVLADWRSILKTLVSLIERLPEEYLADETRFAWLDGGTLWDNIANETFGHVEEHWPDLQAWLDKLPR